LSELHGGGCLCGSIRYRVRGEPRRTVVCHCTFCQRSTGSAFLTEAAFLKEQVEIEGGPITTYDHISDETGRRLTLQFCPKCGTKIGMELEWFPEIQMIFVGTLDDPHWLKMERQIFARSAVRWMQYPPDAEVFQIHHAY
jgi:hypothetical protein